MKNEFPVKYMPGVLAGILIFAAFVFAKTAFAEPKEAYNWAGYLAQGSYHFISSSWKVPSVAATNEWSGNGEWVGIGGYSSSDLIQAGTRAISHDGIVTYTAWYELLPSVAVVTPLGIHPGDEVSAFIREESTDEWRITLTDHTTGQTFSTRVPYQSSYSSAEWIEEMPRGADGYEALDTADPVTFKNVTGSAKPLTMVSESGEILASVSALSKDSFTARTNLP